MGANGPIAFPRAVRRWARTPALATIAIFSLSVGLAANVALSLIWDSLFFRKLPVRAPNELVRIVSTLGDITLSTRAWEFIRDRNPIFREVFAYIATDFTSATHGGASNRLAGAFCSGEMFTALGLVPASGQLLRPEDDRAGADPRAVISTSLWQREFGSDPAAVGQRIELDGVPFDIVGVAPAAFVGMEIGRRADVFVTAATRERFATRSAQSVDGGWLAVYARLAAPHDLTAAIQALRTWQPVLREGSAPAVLAGEYLPDALGLVDASAGISFLRREYAHAAATLAGLGIAVLLIVGVNVGALIVSRVIDRRGDIATCLALGATRRRLFAELGWEVFVVVAVAVALAAWFGVHGAETLAPYLSSASLTGSQPYLAITPGWTLVIVIAATTALLWGLLIAFPAFVQGRTQVTAHLGRGRASADPISTRAVSALLCVQVVLSTIVLVVALLLMRSFWGLMLKPAGVDRERVLVASISRSFEGVVVRDRIAWITVIRDALQKVPGVDNVSASVITPLSGRMAAMAISVPNSPTPSPAGAMALFNRVTPGFFDVFGTPIVAGRDFAPEDVLGGPPVAIINRAFADRHYYGTIPVGQTIIVSGQRTRIIGVVADSAQYTLREERRVPMAYGALAQWMPSPLNTLRFAIRAEEPDRVRGAVAHAVRRLDPAAQLEFRTLEDQAEESINRERLLAWIGGAFALCGVLAAILGLYGTFVYQVERKKPDYAIRLAVGAEPRDIIRMALRQTAIVAGSGASLAIAVVVLGGRLIEGLLFAIAPTDPTALASGVAIVLGAVCLACYSAVRRVLGTEVTTALHSA